MDNLSFLQFMNHPSIANKQINDTKLVVEETFEKDKINPFKQYFISIFKVSLKQTLLLSKIFFHEITLLYF